MARRRGLLRGVVRLSWGRPADFPATRDHGFTDGHTVTVAPKLASAPRRRVLAILSHELAHACLLQAGLEDHSEVDADAVAARILGASIGYDREDVQAAGLRRKRPRYLPQ